MENDNATTHSTQAATNEALAERAKAGDGDALAALWMQNRGLLGMMGRRCFFLYEQQAKAAGITLEDVEQEGYFIVRLTVKRVHHRFMAFCKRPFATPVRYAQGRRAWRPYERSRQSGRPLSRRR